MSEKNRKKRYRLRHKAVYYLLNFDFTNHQSGDCLFGQSCDAIPYIGTESEETS